MKKMLVVLALALFLMAVAEHYNIDPAWFLIVWYLSDNIPTRNAWTGVSSVGVGTAAFNICGMMLKALKPLQYLDFL